MNVKLSVLSGRLRRRRRAIPEWFGRLCDDYLRYLVRNGRRPNTLRTYQSLLRDLGEWLLGRQCMDARSLTPEMLERWQDSLQSWAQPRTQRVAATAVRGLLRWAADQELVAPTLWLRVARPRAPRLLPRPIPEPELALIQHYLEPHDPGNLERLRTRALFFVLFSSGARISEALSLRRTSLQDGAADVIQKGGAPHTLLISQRAEEVLAEYVALRLDSCPALFANNDGRPLAAKEAQAYWDELCEGLGIHRFTSHQIRHTTATAMLAQGIDWLVIARHLGHRSLQAIQGYTAVALKSRLAAVEALDRSRAS